MTAALPHAARRRQRRAQRGVATVEFAVTAMLLITILFGVSELGRAMVQYDTLVKSARTASRYLSNFGAGDAAAIGNARCLAVYGNSACSGSALVPNLTTAMVAVCDASSCAGTHLHQQTGRGLINLVTVTISGLQFRSLASAFVPNFTFDPISATMAQGQ